MRAMADALRKVGLSKGTSNEFKVESMGKKMNYCLKGKKPNYDEAWKIAQQIRVFCNKRNMYIPASCREH